MCLAPPVATRQQCTHACRTPMGGAAVHPLANGKGRRHEQARGPGGHDERRDLTGALDAVSTARMARVPARAGPARAGQAATYETAALSRATVVSRPSSSMLSKRPGDTFDPVTATRIG